MVHLTMVSAWFRSIHNSLVKPQSIQNLISATRDKYYLVIYTDIESLTELQEMVMDPHHIHFEVIDTFYGLKYKKEWKKMGRRRSLFTSITEEKENDEWMLKMILAEKPFFIQRAFQSCFFPVTLFYCWCDIGYFYDAPPPFEFPKFDNIQKHDKIYYSCVANDFQTLQNLYEFINSKLEISENEPSCISTHFFLLHNEMIDKWANVFESTMVKYFEHGIHCSESIITTHCIFVKDTSHLFELVMGEGDALQEKKCVEEDVDEKDNQKWYLFKRLLS